MGFLKKLFSKSRATVQQLPAGSITVNRDGQMVATTVSSGYPEESLRAVARDVLLLFREASEAQMPLDELDIHFASLRITARELRGGAIIFISPQNPRSPAPN
jgi:hypothetical protein